jgi:hypothetical protein
MVIFENRKQAKKVRWVLLASVLWAAGWLYWAWSLSGTYGLSPGDGGVLKPAAERYGLAAIVAPIGLIPFAGMMLYARLYLVRIERQRDAVLLVTIGLLTESHHMHAPDDFTQSNYREGRLQSRISVHAPWITLHVRGRMLPYVVDMQADFVNRSAIDALARRKRRGEQQ